MGRRVDLGNNLHTILLSQQLQLDELLLRVAAVGGRKSGVGVALEPEGRLSLQPVVVEILLEPVVVQVQLQRVHLVEPHQAHQLTEVVHGNVFAAHVEEESPQAVLGNVDGLAAGQLGHAF